MDRRKFLLGALGLPAIFTLPWPKPKRVFESYPPSEYPFLSGSNFRIATGRERVNTVHSNVRTSQTWRTWRVRDAKIICAADIQAATAWLKANKIPFVEDHLWHSYVHPDVEFDILGDRTVLSVHQTETAIASIENPLIKGAVPTVYGVKFFRGLLKTFPIHDRMFVIYSNSTQGDPGAGYLTVFVGAGDELSEDYRMGGHTTASQYDTLVKAAVKNLRFTRSGI